jgi:hypothetical protein
VARYGSCLSSVHGIQYTHVPFFLKINSRTCGSLLEYASNVRRQIAARGSLALLSS